MEYYVDQNSVYMRGNLVNGLTVDHSAYGETIYMGALCVPRLSGTVDRLPLTVPGRLLENLPQTGNSVAVHGQIRSYNRHPESGSRLLLTVFAKEVEGVELNDLEDPPCNEVILVGSLCKPPVFRTTPFLREIADLLIAVNRAYRKADYIPCITWGRTARLAAELPVGSRVRVEGRLQSRAYTKVAMDGLSVERTAYELSCSRLEPLDY